MEEIINDLIAEFDDADVKTLLDIKRAATIMSNDSENDVVFTVAQALISLADYKLAEFEQSF